MLAIIGGSGLTQLANLDVSHREVVRTPFGDPSGPVTFGEICGRPVAFLARHGYGHTIPPHEVNYRANLWALWKRGAKGIISVASVTIPAGSRSAGIAAAAAAGAGSTAVTVCGCSGQYARSGSTLALVFTDAAGGSVYYLDAGSVSDSEAQKLIAAIK